MPHRHLISALQLHSASRIPPATVGRQRWPSVPSSVQPAAAQGCRRLPRPPPRWERAHSTAFSFRAACLLVPHLSEPRRGLRPHSHHLGPHLGPHLGHHRRRAGGARPHRLATAARHAASDFRLAFGPLPSASLPPVKVRGGCSNSFKMRTRWSGPAEGEAVLLEEWRAGLAALAALPQVDAQLCVSNCLLCEPNLGGP